MSQHHPAPQNDLEEAAQGHDLFRSPGADLRMAQARDQAIASGWLPPDAVFEWPSFDTHRGIITRRQDLYDAMQRLESSVARASNQDDWGTGVTDALAHLDTVLQRHVDETEGPDGLFVEVIDRAPHLIPDIETLRNDHLDLIAACQAVVNLLADQGEVVDVRRKVLGMLGRLAVHRQRGAELLFDTYDVDLAAAN